MTNGKKRIRRSGRTTFVLLSLTLAGGMVVPSETAQADQLGATTCKEVRVPVVVGDQSGPITGTLCSPPKADTVQLLIHGFTYDQHYFDWTYRPETHSYARAANKAGYATLAIDRLGTGGSIHPTGAFDTFQADVKTAHAVVQALRNGSTGERFNKVISVGHSVGSMVASNEAGIYRDVDALITTGFSHSLNYLNAFPKYVNRAYPARSDPKFAGSTTDPTYITSFPGTKKYYYNAPNSDPAVVREDEKFKGTDNLVEIATLGGYGLLNVDRTLDIPVLAINGQKDPIFCGLQAADCENGKKLATYERRWYGKGSAVEGYTIPDTGHNTVLEQSSAQGIHRMLDFSQKYVNHGSGTMGTKPGTRPAIPPPPSIHMSALDQAIQSAFGSVIMPTINAYSRLVDPLPGVGNPTTDPVPQTGALLSKVGNLENKLLGSMPQDVLSHL